jgi:glycosyltransferase involved in cell wall biosynthesis
MHATIFIIAPAITPDGPVRGAIALAKSLSAFYKVVFISLKGGDSSLLAFKEKMNIDLMNLGSIKGWRSKRSEVLKKMSRNRNLNIIISYCFSADAFSFTFKNRAIICASIRANNYNNYRHSYGFLGLMLAFVHYKMLRWFDRVYSLDSVMANAIRKYSGCDAVSVGNFIDEELTLNFRKAFVCEGTIKLIFVGSLTERKQPLLFLEALKKLTLAGYNVEGILLGDGPMRDVVETFITKEGLKSHVTVLGFLKNPLDLIASSDIFVLPSLSEGAPRAALEALFLGLPCVLRDVDGNSQIINNGITGALFGNNDELPDAIIRAIKILDVLRAEHIQIKPNLLRHNNTKEFAISRIKSDIRSLISGV